MYDDYDEEATRQHDDERIEALQYAVYQNPAAESGDKAGRAAYALGLLTLVSAFVAFFLFINDSPLSWWAAGVAGTSGLIAIFFVISLVGEGQMQIARGEIIMGEQLLNCYRKYFDYFWEARTAVVTVRSSQAARTDWLGDVDFSQDLYLIAAATVKASETKELIFELEAIPDHTVADNEALHRARKLVDELTSTLEERTALLQQAAKRAKSVDRALQEQDDRSANAEQRAALRERINKQIAGTVAPLEKHSDPVDSVTARVKAFHEIQAIIQRHRVVD